MFENFNERSIADSPPVGPLYLPGVEEESMWTPVQSVPSKYVGHRSLRRMTSASDNIAKGALIPYKKTKSELSAVDFGVQELMLHAITQTAITVFEPTSTEIFAQDGYMIDECGQLRTKTFVYAENARYRLHHQISSFRTGFGCAWVRTTTIHRGNEPAKKRNKSQTVTSLVFYPTTWLQCLGVRGGIEAVLASAGRSWLFNCRFTMTRAVSDDSLIFELCRTGQTRAVEALLEKGMASVVDTSPKGWKPLHVSFNYRRALAQWIAGTDRCPVCCGCRSCRSMRYAHQGRCRQVCIGL